MDGRNKAAAGSRSVPPSLAPRSDAVLAWRTIHVDPALYTVALGAADPEVRVVQRALVVARALHASAVLANQAPGALRGRKAGDAYAGVAFADGSVAGTGLCLLYTSRCV